MRYLFALLLALSIFGESHASNTCTDSIPKRGLGISFSFLNTRFYYDSTEIRETGLKQKLLNRDKKMLKSYNLNQVSIGVGGIGVGLASGFFVYAGIDGIFAINEKREGYERAWQLPVFSALMGGIAYLVAKNGEKNIKNMLNEYNKGNGLGVSVPKTQIVPASSGIGIALRF